MDTQLPAIPADKLLRHYSTRREADLVLRIRYRVEPAGDCRIYQIDSVEELTD